MASAGAPTGSASDAGPGTPTDSAPNKSTEQVSSIAQPEEQGQSQSPQGFSPAHSRRTSGSNHDDHPRVFHHNNRYVPQTDQEVMANRGLALLYDRHLMPILFLAFLFFFLDKSSIAFARIHGLEDDLGLTNNQFNIALSLFFVTNILFSIPGNLLVRRVGGRLWLPSLIVAWGVVTVSSGFVKDFIGLCLSRVFLGVAESSFMGSVLIYLGFFYTQDELVLRVGIFYSSSPLASAFGGLLASQLSKIRWRGFNAWPWIFFVEGGLTILLGFVAYWYLPNTPEDASFLTARYRPLALERMKVQDEGQFVQLDSLRAAALDPEGAGARPAPAMRRDRFQLRHMKRAICNFMTIAMSVGAFFSLQSIYSFSLFLPTIVQGLVGNPQKASIMVIWPNCLGFFCTLGFCFMARRLNNTIAPMGICAALGVVGYTMLLAGGSNREFPTQYGGTFVVAMCVHSLPPMALAWLSTNVSPHYARATALGFMLAIGNLAAFPASFTYLKFDAPWFPIGHSINLTCAVGLFAVCGIVGIKIKRENKKRDSGERNYRLNPDRYNGMTKEQYEFELGWLHPWFRFKT